MSRIAQSNENCPAIRRVPRHRRGGFSNQGASLSAVKVADGYEGVAIDARRLDDLDIADIGFNNFMMRSDGVGPIPNAVGYANAVASFITRWRIELSAATLEV